MPTTTARDLRAPVALGALTVLLEVGYPLVHGQARDVLTVLTVLAFAACSTAHAWCTRGRSWALRYLGTTVVLAFTAEAVGVSTGFPFGGYGYASSLGPQLLGVPLVVPLAWAMLAYPCLVVLGPARGALGLVAWDLFLDPQMVAAGHWHWDHPHPGLNGIPLTNTAGWLLVAAVLMAVLSRLPVADADDRVPLALLLWTYGSSVLADLAFFDRPGVALAGGVALGAVLVEHRR